MNPRTREIFEKAIGMTGPERRAYVLEACGNDEALRADVEALLRTHDQAVNFLISPTSGPTAGEAAAQTEPGDLEGPGSTIGPYMLLSRLGKGGFGTVWLAERRDPLVQRVALKILNPGMDTRDVLARFEQERQALAVMNHPNVAKVFDAGATPAGRPYFAMELVPGEPITAYCDRHRLSIRQRLELFIPVCEAVQHAHHKGIIHRDLKPSNILVGVHEGRAVPKVIDFGVAKAVSHTLTAMTIFTEHGHLIGSPEYMSPEQAEMGATDVDTRTDVYSLGVVLYELLSGLLPFDSKSLRAVGVEAICRIIRDKEPPRPSTRLGDSALEPGEVQPSGTREIRDVNALMDASAILRKEKEPSSQHAPARLPSSSDSVATRISEHRRTTVVSLVRELRRELEWIPLMAIRKDRAERYDTPMDLAQDIQRYLKGEPLRAGPESALYRFRKLVRRNKGLVTASGAVVLALVLGLGTTLWQYQRANDRAEAATRAEAEQSKQRTLAEEAGARESRQRVAAQESAAAEARERQAADRAIESLGTFAWSTRGSGDKPVPAVMEFLGRLDKSLDGGLVRADPARLARLRVYVAGLYQSWWGLEQAVTVLQKGLDEVTHAGAGESQDADRVRAYLAFALVGLGRARDAAKALDGAVERSRQRTDDLPLRLLVLHTNGAVCNLLRDFPRAEESLLEAMQIQEALGGAGPVPLDDTVDLLAAAVARDPKQLDRATDLARKALDLRRENYGPRHPKVAISLNTLGIRLQQRAELAAAADAFREALDIDALGTGSPTLFTATIQHSFAAVLRDREMVKEAITMESQALDTRRQHLNQNSPLIADCLDLLGWLYTDDHDFDAAKRVLGEAMQLRDAPGQTDAAAAATLTGQANLLVLTGDADKAVPLAQRAVRLREASLSEGDWLLWSSRSVLGAALAGTKNYVDAETLIVGAAQAAMEIQPLAARPRRVIVERAVDFYEALGRPDAAAAWRARLGQIQDRP